MAPHLIRARSAYKDIRIRSLHTHTRARTLARTHTHSLTRARARTHTHARTHARTHIHALVVMGWYSEEKNKKRQISMQKRGGGFSNDERAASCFLHSRRSCSRSYLLALPNVGCHANRSCIPQAKMPAGG